jgi:hypothetical protein
VAQHDGSYYWAFGLEGASYMCLRNVALIVPQLRSYRPLEPQTRQLTVYTRGMTVIAGFEAFTAMTMTNAVLWDATPCGSCKKRRSGGTYCLHIRVERISELGTNLAVTSK